MDPVSLALITAIGAGVTSSVTDATKASLVAGYTALKTRLMEKITATNLPHDRELLELAQVLLQHIQQTSSGSQIIHHVQNSAISNSGTATNYNIQGDQHITSV